MKWAHQTVCGRALQSDMEPKKVYPSRQQKSERLSHALVERSSLGSDLKGPAMSSGIS